VDFLLVLIELFPLGVTAEALRAKIDRKSAILLKRGQFDHGWARDVKARDRDETETRR